MPREEKNENDDETATRRLRERRTEKHSAIAASSEEREINRALGKRKNRKSDIDR